MIDWLEVARRELSSDRGEVSDVFTVGESRDPQKSGSPETSDGESPGAREHDLKGQPPIAKGTAEKRVSAVFTAGRTRNPEKSTSLEMPATRSDDPVSKIRDLENPSTLEEATAKTAERRVSDVFAVGAPEGLGEFASGGEPIDSIRGPPSRSQISDNPLDGALRKPPKPTEEGCPRDDEALDGELRKPSKPLQESERLSPNSNTAARWHRWFEDRSIVVQRARDMPPEQAKAEAFRHIVIEYLNETHPDTDPRICAHCRGPDLPLTPTLPIGWGERHAWLHSGCLDSWRTQRRLKAEDDLARLGVVRPTP
jgi:hypothetical protein